MAIAEAGGRGGGDAKTRRGASRVLLLTGAPGVGKTTVFRRALEKLPRTRVVGFFTREIRDDRGRRTGFEAVALPAGEEVVIAHVRLPGRPRVGRYGVDAGAVDALARRALALREDVDLYAVDEIGKMEGLSAAFVEGIRRILASGAPLLATVGRRGGGLIREAKAHPEAEVWTVTRENRGHLPDMIAEWAGERGLR